VLFGILGAASAVHNQSAPEETAGSMGGGVCVNVRGGGEGGCSRGFGAVLQQRSRVAYVSFTV
jgi:hypothetical protein